MKVCAKCKLEKSFDEFGKNKSNNDGLHRECKLCRKNYYLNNKNVLIEKQKKYYSLNKEKNKLKISKCNQNYRENNKEKIKLIRKNYYLNNKEKVDLKCKVYYEKNKETILNYQKNYRDNNKEKINNYKKIRREADLLFKLSYNIGGLIRNSLKRKNYTKKSRTYEILGCTYDEFKLHLESKFESWMNWNNHGLYNGELNYGWDIDHIIPLSSAKTEEEFIKLNHYTNLQPLCSKVNRDIKKNKF